MRGEMSLKQLVFFPEGLYGVIIANDLTNEQFSCFEVLPFSAYSQQVSRFLFFT
jgi:hypothetical protein